MSITTSANVKLLLDIPDATSAEDDIIVFATSAANTFVEDYTGCTFTSALTSAYYDGSGLPFLYVKPPILAIDTLKIAGNKNGLSTATALTPATQYIYYSNSGKVQLTSASHFPIGNQNVYIEYSHGYTYVPQTIVQAATEIAVDIFFNHRKGRFGVESRELDSKTGLRQIYNRNFLKPSTEAMLSIYKNPLDEQVPEEL